MTFTETRLKGIWLIQPDIHEDERGTFTRTFDRWEFARHGLNPTIVQTAVSWNEHSHTLRGLHFQPGQAKLVSCVRGRLFDVVVNCLTREWVATYLTTNELLYVAAGFAHGFLTLQSDTKVAYALSAPFDATASKGLRWDDPALNITWPALPKVMSQNDQSWPLIST